MQFQKRAIQERAILLSSCGAATYQLIRNLVSPKKPTDKSFNEIVDLVQGSTPAPPIHDRPAFQLSH